MAKRNTTDEAPRQGRVRAAGEIVGAVGGMAFKRFGFVQGAVVSRWREIVGERYARVSTPECIRFPAGKKAGGTLTLLVEGAHAPLMQHLAPTITERVNRFFGYEAVVKIAFRQGTPAKQAPRPSRPAATAVPRELGEGLRAIADPELRTVLESLAGKLDSTNGLPRINAAAPLPKPINNPE
ncbi:MAG: Zn-ribbon-containing, possibly RNA-binding protein and truncated derivatives [uncultured Sphingomonas sp.]|uniref:Zn-ribbon-containing, possibly RNA-binding protein and truncated derivatives n=1 Tax=uncultured Sphingomonas sp. TaxID=158754 RepID=A0A6J4SWW8_9SPHN|nr:DciA family protein [uncultured Sphingomonas sp.]CAA9507417.1 MAG: Zn-ribbon-containing, possibly RNA-binding protein and truncated derivatives [uncultured Sphingomonas sp.]